MKLNKLLQVAGVPAHLHAEALLSITDAKRRAKGLTLAKWKVRLFKAGKISKLIPWDAERLIAVRPDLKDWDIAPAINITAHGDNVPWVLTADGGRPVPNVWLNQDPESEEYKQAVAANYWCKGEHPRSRKSRKAWYHRNAGEYAAWARGIPVNVADWTKPWVGDGVTVRRNGSAWQIVAKDKWLGFIPVKVRIGFEIDNVFTDKGEQAWYPLPGYDLRAPVTWSVIPGR